MVKKVIFPATKFILLALAIYFFSQKIGSTDFKNLNWQWQSNSIIALFLFLLFWLLNLILDAKAWQIVQSTLSRIELSKAIQHNLKCYGLAFISPVNSGELVGRYIIQEDPDHQRKALFLTFWTHAPKFFSKALLSFLIIPFLFPKLDISFKLLIWGSFLILSLLYIRLEKWISLVAEKKWGKREFKNYLVKGQPRMSMKLKLLGLNLSRLLVYSLQLTLCLWTFGISDLSLSIVLSIPVYYFISALIPSYTGLDFLIKGTLSLYYFDMFSDNNLGFAIATTIIWAFNWAIPSTVGLASLKKNELARIKRRKA